MRNITLSADEELIEKARLMAKQRRRTLNQEFRDWLVRYTRQTASVSEFDALLEQLVHVRSAGPYSRDVMAER